ncbi:SETMR methyltransferase, partial [Acromyrmex charruanus]
MCDELTKKRKRSFSEAWLTDERYKNRTKCTNIITNVLSPVETERKILLLDLYRTYIFIYIYIYIKHIINLVTIDLFMVKLLRDLDELFASRLWRRDCGWPWGTVPPTPPDIGGSSAFPDGTHYEPKVCTRMGSRTDVISADFNNFCTVRDNELTRNDVTLHKICQNFLKNEHIQCFSVHILFSLAYYVALLTVSTFHVFTCPTPMAKFNEFCYELLPHPAYLPYLHIAPCDYFLFSNVKKCFGGKKFTTREQLIAEAKAYFEGLDKSYYSDGLEKLENRWIKCIELKGDYVEK